MKLVAPLQRKVSRRKGEREGLNLIHKASGAAWFLLGRRFPSIRFNGSQKLLRAGLTHYEDHLLRDLEPPSCLPYGDLLHEGYLKKKHWVYAGYMATLSTLPLLYKIQNRGMMTEAVLAKTAVGASTKLLDNLNDSVQSTEEALRSLNRYQDSLINPFFESANLSVDDSKVLRAANSAEVMGRWVPRILIRCEAPYMRRVYDADVKKLIQGQVDSITPKHSDNHRIFGIEDYLGEISEKSIGDVWLDVDLCFMEDGLGHLDQETVRGLNILREGYRWVFKASLIWDDAQDLSLDVSQGSINSSILLALREGVIDRDSVDQLSPQQMVERLNRYGIITDTIYLADLLFIKGIKRIEDAKVHLPDIIDWKALMFAFRFVRLFNLRKILLHRKDPETLRLFIDSLRNFDNIYGKIPDRIMQLETYV